MWVLVPAVDRAERSRLENDLASAVQAARDAVEDAVHAVGSARRTGATARRVIREAAQTESDALRQADAY